MSPGIQVFSSETHVKHYCVLSLYWAILKQEGDRKSLVTASLVQGQIGVEVLSTD